jgi:hypothetical protein
MRLIVGVVAIALAALVGGCGKSRAELAAEAAARDVHVRALVEQDEQRARQARAEAITRAQDDFDQREQALRAESARADASVTVPVPPADQSASDAGAAALATSPAR